MPIKAMSCRPKSSNTVARDIQLAFATIDDHDISPLRALTVGVTLTPVGNGGSKLRIIPISLPPWPDEETVALILNFR